MRGRWHRMVLLSTTIGLALAIWVGQAGAFCRSTTCRGECPTDGNGCPSTGQPLFWPRSCLGFSLQKNGTQSLDLADVRLAIQKSFQAWSEVPCVAGVGAAASMTFSEIEDVACNKSQYNADGANVNVVIFRDDDWTYHGIDGTLAKTAVTYDDTTGEIFDADIEINAAFNNLTVTDTKVGYDLRAIVTHEAGHFIGIAHSPDPVATMFATYAPGSFAGRALADDDVAAICAVYPPGRQGSCDTTPRGGLGATCADPAKSGCGVAPRLVMVGAEDGEPPLVALGGFGAFAALALASRRARRPRARAR
jgi:hypothetical protein